MREKFELYIKVVGLVLLSLGVLVMLNAILLFFHVPYSNLYSSSVFPEQVREQLRTELSRARTWTAVHLLLSGVLQAAIGGYLMRSNNLIVRLCYPQTGSRTQLDSMSGPPPAGMTPPGVTNREAASRSRSDTWYAPPGYFR